MENRTKSPINAYFPDRTMQNPLRGSIMQNITNSSNLLFRRSTISTSKSKNQPRNDSTNKSKIKALPNYQRYSMGNNLPFVTVFQTIQIERLSDEIETQRVKLKQFERLVFNASNFEIQIKQLSERCTGYQFQIGQYREELDKMNKICQTLFHENQNLKNKQKNLDVVSKAKLEEQIKKNKQLTQEVQRLAKKYQISEQTKQNEIQGIKIMMEQQRKSMIDRQMKDLQVRHQSQIASLTVEIRRMNDALVIKDRDIEDVKKKYSNSQDYIKELKNYGSKLTEYEEKICMLSQQHLRLSQIIDINSNELQMARKKQFKLAQQLNSGKELTFDNEQLRSLVQEKQWQLQQWKNKIIELEEQVARGKQIVHNNQELQAKIGCLNSDNQRLAKLLKQRSAQIEKWKNVALQLEEQNKKRREVQDLLIQKQGQYKVLYVEVQKLQNINKTKAKQVEQIKSKYLASQEQLQQTNRLNVEHRNLEDKNRIQIERIMELQMQIQKLENEATGSAQANNKLKSAQSIIQSFKRETERLQQRISDLQMQLANIKQNQQNLGNEYEKLKQTQTVLKEYQQKLAIISEQTIRLSELLRQKNEDIARLQDEKINSYTTITQLKSVQNQFEQKNRAYIKLKSQYESNQAKLKDYEQKMDEIDQKNKQLFDKLNQDIEILQHQLKQRNKECDDLKIKQAKMQSEVIQKSELEKQCHKQQNRLTVYLRDIEDLKMLNKQYQTSLAEQKRKNQQLQRRSSVASVANSSYSNKSIGSNGPDPQKLLNKINKLQLTLSDLQIKYGDLLKQVNGSSKVIPSESPNASLRNL